MDESFPYIRAVYFGTDYTNPYAPGSVTRKPTSDVAAMIFLQKISKMLKPEVTNYVQLAQEMGNMIDTFGSGVTREEFLDYLEPFMTSTEFNFPEFLRDSLLKSFESENVIFSYLRDSVLSVEYVNEKVLLLDQARFRAEVEAQQYVVLELETTITSNNLDYNPDAITNLRDYVNKKSGSNLSLQKVRGMSRSEILRLVNLDEPDAGTKGNILILFNFLLQN